jgi:hypothetical protein
MSEPEDIPRAVPKPRRAEPLQPDTGAGNATQDQSGSRPADADSDGNSAAEKQKSQSEEALRNVRQGYR